MTATTTDPATDHESDPVSAPAEPADAVQRVQANGIELAYETFGDASDPTVLLVMGLGTQMIAWPDDFCIDVADAGFHVVRYDNRDVGLSTHIDAPTPTVKDMLLRRPPPYRIADMAADAVGLLDALDIDRAHVVGASMGGFISQTVAIAHPDRVATLSLLMTSTGSRRVGQLSPRLVQRMANRSMSRTREQAMDEAVETYRLIGSPGFLDADLVRELAGQAYDSSYDPGGAQRQLAAILAQPNRTRDLQRLSIPTLVIHGLADPLVAASGGLAIAKAVPGARFVGHAGMGHDLPRTMADSVRDDVLRLVASAG